MNALISKAARAIREVVGAIYLARECYNLLSR